MFYFEFLDQSVSYETNTCTNYESERHHGLDKISKHCFDSISVTTTHTYVELYVKHIKPITETETACQMGQVEKSSNECLNCS